MDNDTKWQWFSNDGELAGKKRTQAASPTNKASVADYSYYNLSIQRYITLIARTANTL